MVSYRVLVVVIPGYCWLLVGLGAYRVLLVVMYYMAAEAVRDLSRSR